MEKSFVTGSWQ
jgi:2-iminobutanoate/2-iminopropanoate deaminase